MKGVKRKRIQKKKVQIPEKNICNLLFNKVTKYLCA